MYIIGGRGVKLSENKCATPPNNCPSSILKFTKKLYRLQHVKSKNVRQGMKAASNDTVKKKYSKLYSINRDDPFKNFF